MESRELNNPKEGYWLIRLAKGGPLVPASIQRIHTTFEPGNPQNEMDRSPFLAAFINGNPVSLEEVWHRKGQPISKEEYLFQLADSAWVRDYAPNDPKANPKKAVDFSTLPIPF